MSDDQQRGELERLRAEVERLKAAQHSPTELHFRVSPKGGVSVYGLGRFPVTLYKQQWLRLIDRLQDLRAFLEDHSSELAEKKTTPKTAK